MTFLKWVGRVFLVILVAEAALQIGQWNSQYLISASSKSSPEATSHSPRSEKTFPPSTSKEKEKSKLLDALPYEEEGKKKRYYTDLNALVYAEKGFYLNKTSSFEEIRGKIKEQVEVKRKEKDTYVVKLPCSMYPRQIPFKQIEDNPDYTPNVEVKQAKHCKKG